MRSLTKKHLLALHTDSDLENIFLENSISTIFQRNRNLKKNIISKTKYVKKKPKKLESVVFAKII